MFFFVAGVPTLWHMAMAPWAHFQQPVWEAVTLERVQEYNQQNSLSAWESEKIAVIVCKVWWERKYQFERMLMPESNRSTPQQKIDFHNTMVWVEKLILCLTGTELNDIVGKVWHQNKRSVKGAKSVYHRHIQQQLHSLPGSGSRRITSHETKWHILPNSNARTVSQGDATEAVHNIMDHHRKFENGTNGWNCEDGRKTNLVGLWTEPNFWRGA